MKLNRFITLILILSSAACASSGGTAGIEQPEVTITQDGAYTVICVDNICRSHKRYDPDN